MGSDGMSKEKNRRKRTRNCGIKLGGFKVALALQPIFSVR